jgi:hypothetical protein
MIPDKCIFNDTNLDIPIYRIFLGCDLKQLYTLANQGSKLRNFFVRA